MIKKKPTYFSFSICSEIFRITLILLVCLSFLATEVAKANEFFSNSGLELIDFSEEGESSEEEKSEEGTEKEGETEVNPDFDLAFKWSYAKDGSLFYVIQKIPDAHQENRLLPPEA